METGQEDAELKKKKKKKRRRLSTLMSSLGRRRRLKSKSVNCERSKRNSASFRRRRNA